MTGFEKDCPVCNQRFTSLIKYTEHLGKDHRDIPTDQILKMGKEDKWTLGDK